MSIVDAALQRLKAKRASESAHKPEAEPKPAPIVGAARRERSPEAPRGAAVVDAAAPRLTLGRADESFPTVHDGQPRLSGQVRAIKHVLLDRVRDARAAGRAPVVLVTSAVPGDGKSFVAVNISLSLSRERDLSVTLVDADLARKRVSTFFGATESPGVADCLTGAASIGMCRSPTDVQNLFVVPAGHASPESSEQLTSTAWDEFVESTVAAGPASLLVVDSAPILATGEASRLAQAADAVVFVVRAGQTPVTAVQEALSRLTDPGRVVLVLNGSAGGEDADYYHYGAYSQNARGGEQ